MPNRRNDCSSETDGGARRSPGEPVETLDLKARHRSTTVEIYDVRCRPHDPSRGPEEYSPSNQIVFPRRGVFMREVRGETLVADANQVLFFNRGEAYRVAHPAGSGDDCTMFAFDETSLWEAVSLHDPSWLERSNPPFRFTHALNDQLVFFFHEELRRAALSRDVERLAVDEAALQLLGALIQGAYRGRNLTRKRPREATVRTHREQLERTKLFLATHFSEDLSLASIARGVSCSQFHLARLFRRQSGVTIHQYRHRLRLREALRRITEGETNLSALALELGFSSHSHLTDSFRSAFGRSPAACRNSQSERRLRELSKILEVPGLGTI